MQVIAKLAAVLLKLYDIHPGRINNPRLHHTAMIAMRDIRCNNVTDVYANMQSLLIERAEEAEVSAREITHLAALLWQARNEDDPIATAVDVIMGNEETAYISDRIQLTAALLSIDGRPRLLEPSPGAVATLGEAAMPNTLPGEGHWLWSGEINGTKVFEVDDVRDVNKELAPEVLIPSTIMLLVREVHSGNWPVVEKMAETLTSAFMNVSGALMEARANPGTAPAPEEGGVVKLPQEWLDTVNGMFAAEGSEVSATIGKSIAIAKVIGELSAFKAGLVPPLSTIIASVARLNSKEDEPVIAQIPTHTCELSAEWRGTLKGLIEKSGEDITPESQRVVDMGVEISKLPSVIRGAYPALNELLAWLLYPEARTESTRSKVIRVIDGISGLGVQQEPTPAAEPAAGTTTRTPRQRTRKPAADK